MLQLNEATLFFSEGNQPDVLQEVTVGIISNSKFYYNYCNYTIIPTVFLSVT